MKYMLKNTCFQPLSFALCGGGSIHLRPREIRSISERDVSAEIRQAADKGLVDLIPQVVSAPKPNSLGDDEPKRRRKE